MNIQSSLNQGFSLLALLASQSPKVKEVADIRKGGRTVATTSAAVDAAVKPILGSGTKEEDFNVYENTLKQDLEAKKAYFEVNPTEEARKAYAQAQSDYDEQIAAREWDEELTKKEAEKRRQQAAAEEQERLNRDNIRRRILGGND